MSTFRLPAGEARRTLVRDLRDGHAGWIVRLGLSFVAAAVLLACAMIVMGLLEASSGWLREAHIALVMGGAGALWCVVLALIWWTFRRFMVALKALFCVIAIWAIAIPSMIFIESVMWRGEGYMMAAVAFLAIAASFGSVILLCYQRYRAGPGARAIVHVRVACPDCGYSLDGLSECRCPECGTQHTVRTMVEALGRGQIVAEEDVKPPDDAPLLEPPPGAVPEPG